MSHYDERRDPIDHVVKPVLPEEIGLVHAVRKYRFVRLMRPTILSRWSYETATCGATVKVLPVEFDAGDEDSCPRCVGPVLRKERFPIRRGRHEAMWDDLDDDAYGIDRETSGEDDNKTA